MKAAVIDGNKHISIQEMDKPVSDGNRVILKIAYNGICGSDLHYWKYGDTWANGWITGHEFSGYVEDPGSRDDLKVGDRIVVIPSDDPNLAPDAPPVEERPPEPGEPTVWGVGIDMERGCPGAMAEYVSLLPFTCIKLPDSIDMKTAAVNEPSAVGLYGAKHIDPEKDKKILVVGGGIIGLMTAMWVKKRGADLVVMAEAGDNRLKFAAERDFIDAVVDAKAPDYREQILALNDGKLYDAMYECVGIEPTLNNYLRTVKSYGKVIVMGVPNEMIPFDWNTMITRNMDLISSHAWDLEDFDTSLKAIESGEIDLDQFVTDIIPIEGVQAAFENLTAGDTENVKILVEQKG